MSKPPAQTTVIQNSPVADPAPPVTATAPDVIKARQDAMRQGLMKKNIKRTVFAGDTAGAPTAGMKPSVGGNPFVDSPIGPPKG